MKIVYCINAVYNSAGMERILMLKANSLAGMGHEVCIVTAQQQGRPAFFDFSPKIKMYDLGIDYSGLTPIRTLKRWRLQKLHRQKLEALLKQLKADVCISMFDNDFHFLYKINDGSKKVLELHFCMQKILGFGSRIMRAMNMVRVWLLKREIKKYSKFVTLTEEDKQDWGNLPNITVIPNFLSSFPERKAALKNKKVLAVGRIKYQKGYDRLVAAWNLVHKKCPDWQLVIRGNGDKTEIQAQIDRLGLTDAVAIMPATKDIQDEYMNSSMLVLSSRYEGLPMVLLEAMSCGLPVVSFACPCGPKEVVTDGVDGLLCDNGDVRQLADGIIRLIQDDELRGKMGSAAWEKARKYTESNTMKKWTDLLEEICA